MEQKSITESVRADSSVTKRSCIDARNAGILQDPILLISAVERQAMPGKNVPRANYKLVCKTQVYIHEDPRIARVMPQPI